MSVEMSQWSIAEKRSTNFDAARVEVAQCAAETIPDEIPSDLAAALTRRTKSAASVGSPPVKSKHVMPIRASAGISRITLSVKVEGKVVAFSSGAALTLQ
jgi:hypothetical protein